MQTVSCAGSLVSPSKVICVGRNYAAHIQELGNEVPDDMVVFIKPNSAIGNTLHATLGDEQLHYEGELAFLVEGGQLAAVGFGLDLTKRALQTGLKNKGLPWERAKSFDGAALFSDFVPLPADLDTLELQLEIGVEQRQRGGVPLMMYKPAAILEELQTFLSLEDGDIIMTGTPAGVGAVDRGKQFTGTVLAADQPLVSATWIAQ